MDVVRPASFAPCLDYVSALSDARNVERAEEVLVCAFDKAVRRKPLAFAAEAVGLCQLNVAEEDAEGGQLASESRDGVLEGCCRVVALMMKRVKLRMFRG